MNFKKTKIVNDYLKNGNSREYTLLKTAEELQELALILIQSVTKDTEIDDQDIIDEIGDVLIRINVLREFFPEDRIQERIEYKLKKMSIQHRISIFPCSFRVQWMRWVSWLVSMVIYYKLNKFVISVTPKPEIR